MDFRLSIGSTALVILALHAVRVVRLVANGIAFAPFIVILTITAEIIATIRGSITVVATVIMTLVMLRSALALLKVVTILVSETRAMLTV